MAAGRIVERNGMCVVCNPACGKCRPVQKKSVTCALCGASSLVERKRLLTGESVACSKCGSPLPTMGAPKLR